LLESATLAWATPEAGIVDADIEISAIKDMERGD
jgi:hypothetical protein